MSTPVVGSLAVTPLYATAADAIVSWDDPGQTWRSLAYYGGALPIPPGSGGTGTSVVFTSGSVVFAGVGGVYAQDNANLFWNDATNALGIGTTTPGAKLGVLSGTNDGISVSDGTVVGVLYSSAALTHSLVVGTTSNHPLVFGTNNTFSRLTIAAGGNVGIGTTSPSARLTIGNNVATGFLDSYGEYQIILNDGGAAGNSYGMGVRPSTFVLNAGNSGGFAFDAAGNVNLATLDQYGQLSASGNIFCGDTAGLWVGAPGQFGLLWSGTTSKLLQWYGTGWYLGWDTSNGTLNVNTNTGLFWSFRTTDWLSYNAKGPVGGLGAYQNSSDERLKSDIAPADVGLAEVLRIVPISYSRLPSEVPVGIEGETRTLHRPPEIGFSAQQLQDVIPAAVSVMGIELPDGTGGLKDANPTLGVTSEAITAALVNAVKTLEARIAALEKPL